MILSTRNFAACIDDLLPRTSSGARLTLTPCTVHKVYPERTSVSVYCFCQCVIAWCMSFEIRSQVMPAMPTDVESDTHCPQPFNRISRFH
ncbi:hypothetical protein CY34DRAFT_512368 [Suillus luteus UH-Slu-Lm8-n1]|uniref:Uncharacterized protein n=1 Tax=Suillus luteus UH-Slu-Lm8-n1 TaxID=930992 RepID=A0A0D0AF12_9AGAM|nr:hypothetical protein CY34DRAFT_512368 [Suillus luteus UH-Slu-Lm8-n1]